ncbi:helix-turn-helix domain-containing protein [Streptomyces diastatochromogenes]|uniref:helix-turn-helix domain-containing protein n=1 Tax=Streptomyces diastatochromogenes TaxID=42236 RepID=UPI000D1C17C7
MTSSEDEDRRRAEKARQVGLFRYSLIQDLLDSTLTTRERGRLACELAAKEHTDPFGRQVKVSWGTIDRWTRAYRSRGFAALVPEPRKAVPRTPPEVLELVRAPSDAWLTVVATRRPARHLSLAPGWPRWVRPVPRLGRSRPRIGR